MAFAFSLPAVVLELVEKGRVKNAPLLIDVKTVFGMKIRHAHEVFLIGLLIHVCVGFLFGLCYVTVVQQDWLVVTNAPYTILSFIVFALFSWVGVNVLLYPLLGFGLFARKEGRLVWLETFVAHLILGGALWLLVQFYQPWFFEVL